MGEGAEDSRLSKKTGMMGFSHGGQFFVYIVLQNQNKLKSLHRASAVSRPATLKFTSIGYGGGLLDYQEEGLMKRYGGKEKLLKKTTEMQCLPLYSILKAINISHIDMFSLDIEGNTYTS